MKNKDYSMLSKLNIVKGGVAKKDLSPILRHLRIAGGWITSTNGRLTISTDISKLKDFNLIVPADKFIKAISLCKNPKLKITEGGRLSISDGKFRALLPLLSDTEFPMPDKRGEKVSVKNLIEGLKKIYQFIGDDASRPWSCGILLYKGVGYATNNTIIARTNIEWSGPPINLPEFLITELFRLNKPLRAAYINSSTITFELEDNVWINSSLLSLTWPNAEELFSKISFDNVLEIPNSLKDDIESIIPFCPDPKLPKILFTAEGITTEAGKNEALISTHELPESIWRAEPILNILALPESESIRIDFSQWPRPCPWIRSDGVEGLIIGLRK